MTTASVAVEQVAVQSVQPQVVLPCVVPCLGHVTSTFVLAGSSTTVTKRLLITNIHFTTATPAVVVLQPRRSDNKDDGFNDEFAVQVIATTATTILCLIRRLDQATGWGQNLRIDIWVVDEVHNP